MPDVQGHAGWHDARMEDENRPMIRKEWLIAMVIVFVAVMALVFTFCATTGTSG